MHELGIMVWNQRSERTADYGYYAPHTEMQLDVTRLKIPPNSLVPGPNQSITLSFSPYTHKIAYFTSITKTELWISDLQLTDIKRAWKDEQYWLGNISGKTDVLIRWGINDRYLIVSSVLKENHLLIYDLVLDEYLEFEGNCDWIIKSPISGQLVIGCTIIQQDKQEFRILDINGIASFSASSNPLLTGILDWSYSKDAKWVLFITADKKIGILESDEKANYLPLMFEMDSSLSLTWSKNLQWSQNGDRILVYGFEPSPKLCPKQKDSGVEDKIRQRSCWFILDPGSGEIIWWPKESIPEKLDIPWDYLRNEYDAALSPDGEWISTTFADSRMGHAYYLLALSTVSDEVRVITLEQAHTIFWP